MKIRKIKYLGTAFLWLITILIPLIIIAPKASASTQNLADAKNCANNLTFIDIAEVDCTFTPAGQSSTVTVKFIDTHPDDYDSNSCSGANFGCSHVMNYKESPPYGFFCDSGNTPRGFADNYSYLTGVTIMGIGDRPLNQTDAGKSLTVNINLGYQDPKTDKCVRASDGTGSDGTMHRTLSSSQTAGIANLLQYSGSGIGSLPGVGDGRLNNKSYSLTSYSGNFQVYASGYTQGQCGGDLIFVYPDGTAARYSLESGGGASKYPDLLAFLTSPLGVTNCQAHIGDRQDQKGVNFYGDQTPNAKFKIAGAPGTTGGGTCADGSTPDPKTGLCADGSTPTPTGTAQQQDNEAVCESRSVGFPIAWLFCPILNAADATANLITTTFEEQLSFTLPDGGSCNTQTTTASPSISPSGCNGLHNAWNIFRIIASSLLVLILLVMVVSEAVGGISFIDPYTIRKMMPRLVASVILIQISWPIFTWMINAMDDLGRQLANLMYLPFGGKSQMTLPALMKNAGIPSLIAGTFSWIALIGVIIATAVALPMVIMFAFIGIVSALTGLLVLIFRKIIIILALILSPIALIAYILPGTERLWKMWWDNFSKALFMFPIAVAIIAGGRIFAHVSGGAVNGTFSNLITFFMVMVGFFGPLFILPKTFKWGGQLMQLAGNAAFKADGYISGKDSFAQKYLRARQQDWKEQRLRSSRERVSDPNYNYQLRKFWQKPLDRFRSGRWDPLKQTPGYRAIGERSVEHYIKEGEEIREKDIEASRAKVLRAGQQIRARGGNWDRYFQEVGNGTTRYFDKDLDGGKGGWVDIGKTSEIEREAAMKQTAILGSATNWRYLESKYEEMQGHIKAGRREEAAKLRKFFDDNVDVIKPKMTHIYNGLESAADVNEGGIATMHGVEVEALLGGLSERIRDPSDGGRITDAGEQARRKAGAEKALATFLQTFEKAANNENIQLENGTLRAVKAFLDSTGGQAFSRDINYGTQDPAAATNPDLRGPDARTSPARDLPPVPTVDSLITDGHLNPTYHGEIARLQTELADKIDEVTGSFNP